MITTSKRQQSYEAARGWLRLVRQHLIFFIFWITVLSGPERANAQNSSLNTDGAWFLCEHAHSQIPPQDGCAVLDDDGFLVREGIVYHVKVVNSRETGCRGGGVPDIVCVREYTHTELIYNLSVQSTLRGIGY